MSSKFLKHLSSVSNNHKIPIKTVFLSNEEKSVSLHFFTIIELLIKITSKTQEFNPKTFVASFIQSSSRLNLSLNLF